MRARRGATAEWTVMVFLNAKNNLEPFSFLNFAQMAKVGSTAGVNILVEYGRPIRHYPLPPGVSGFGNWSKTLRFRVEKGMKPTVAAAAQDIGRTNMGSPDSLGDFVTWGMTAWPAKRYALVIWDHGQGWRAPTATRIRPTPGAPASRRSATVDPRTGLPSDQRIRGGFRYVSQDEDTGDKLYNREIQDGLSAALGGRKLDLLGFDACLMSMVETAYAVRKVSVALAASEELEPGDGWNYERWLAPVVADPAAFDGPALAKQVVTAYRDEYGDRDDATMAAVELRRITAATRALDGVCDIILANVDAALPALKAARRQCDVYAPGYKLSSIDLLRLLDRLGAASSGGSKRLRDAALTARDATKAAILDAHAAATRRGRFGSKGLGIYFPKSRAAFEEDPDGSGYLRSNEKFPVEFVQRCKWSRVIEAWLARDPLPGQR